MRGPRSRGHGGRVATARVSSSRDWAVAIGSHLQQDMNIPQATPQPSAPFNNKLDFNIGDHRPVETVVLGEC